MSEVQQVSVDWCDEIVRRALPWDPEQYIEVRRFTGKEKRRRQALAMRFRTDMTGEFESLEASMPYDDLKRYEWETAIVDYRLKDSRGAIQVFGKADHNRQIYDHISGPLEKFIDDVVLELNKEDATEKPSRELGEVEGNSRDSSESN